MNKFAHKSFISGASIYLFSNLLLAIIPLALLPILTRYLSPAEYGQIAIFQALVGALGSLVGLNTVGAAGRKYYDSFSSNDSFKYFIAACLQILVASCGVILFIVFIFRSQLSDWLGLPSHWILLAVFMSTVSFVVQLRLGQWQVRKLAKQYGALQVSQSVLNMALSLLLVVYFLQGSWGRISAQVWVMGLFAILAMVLLKRDGLFSFFAWRPVHLKEALAFGVPLIPHVGGIFLLSSVDRFVINEQLGLAQTGVYLVAVQLTGAAALIFDAINKAYVPWLFERLTRDDEQEKRQIVHHTYAWFLIILIGAGLAFPIGPWLVALVVGPQYTAAGEVIGWLALGQAFSGMYLMVTNYIFYSKRTGLLSLVTIASGLINIILLTILVGMLGIKGAAISFSIAMGVRFFLTWWVATKRHPMPWFT